MSFFRQCSRNACSGEAVATLTYVYSDSTAVLGPLAVSAEPHSYDLCQAHASRLTAPRGWEVVRVSVPGDAVQSESVQPDSVAGNAPDGAAQFGSVRGESIDAATAASSTSSLQNAPTRRDLIEAQNNAIAAEQAQFELRKKEISKPLNAPDDDWAVLADVVSVDETPSIAQNSVVANNLNGPSLLPGVLKADDSNQPARVSSIVPEGYIPPETLLRPRHAADPEPLQQGEVARRGHLRMLRDDS